MVHQASSLYAASTEQSADSVEAHPTRPGLFALGTYQIQQHADRAKCAAEQDEPSGTSGPPISRRGRLSLMQSRTREDGRIHCDTLYTVDTAAILDMKWLHPSTSLFSLVLADSTMSLYRLHEGPAPTCAVSLLDPIHVRMNTTGALCLSLDWSDRIGGSIGGFNDLPSSTTGVSSIVSQSNGTLAHLSDVEVVRKGQSDAVSSWQAHDYEAWTTAFDCWSAAGNVVWSGGDDLALKGWDVRTPCTDDMDRQPTFTHKRSFEGGVTSMQSHHLVQHLWAIGSYDSHVRLFDARHPLRPLSTTEVGGGVWRVKWHPTQRNKLLVGCMHDGFKVLTLNADGSVDNDDDGAISSARHPMKLQTRFDGHDSLAYGCDWDRGRSLVDETASAQRDYVYSCSFYDAMLHAWSC